MLNWQPICSVTRRTSCSATAAAPDIDRLEGRLVARREIGMVEHGDEHGRHHERVGAAVGLEQLEGQPRVEVGHDDVGAVPRDGGEFRHRAAADVVHRHRVDTHVAVSHSRAFADECGLVDDALVVQQCTLGEPGGARGVLDLHGVGGARCVGNSAAGSPEARNSDHSSNAMMFAKCGSFGIARTRRSRAGRRPRYDRDEEQADGAGLAKNVLEFVRAIRRVDRDDDHPRHGDRLLQDDPLRAVRRPDRDAIAGLESREQAARGRLGFGQELGDRSSAGAEPDPRPRRPARVGRARRPPRHEAVRGE